MSYIRIISISALLLLQSVSSQAKSVDQDLRRCASVALQELNQPVKKISVNTGRLKKQDLDHAISSSMSEYRLRLTNKASGQNLGIVTCSLGNSGDIIALTFDL